LIVTEFSQIQKGYNIKVLEAIILDFNGVVISDEEYHRESWRRFVKELGIELTEKELQKNVFGKRESEIFPFLLNREVSEVEVENLSAKRNKIVYELEGKLLPVPGVEEFIRKVKREKIPLGLATNSRRSYLNHVLNEFQIEDAFDVIVTAEDVTIGKPDPQIYLKTAKLLHSNPKNCLVFEDSLHGIEAAKNTEMKVIALTTTIKDKNLLIQADRVIHNFYEVSLEECKEFFK